MPILKLSSCGHYPSKYVEVSDDELKEIKRLEEGACLHYTREGRDIINQIWDRPNLKVYDHTSIVYR